MNKKLNTIKNFKSFIKKKLCKIFYFKLISRILLKKTDDFFFFFFFCVYRIKNVVLAVTLFK